MQTNNTDSKLASLCENLEIMSKLYSTRKADMHKFGCEKETCHKGSNENDLNLISSDTEADQYQVQ